MLFERPSVTAGAALSPRPRVLVCTEDGLWLWPGTALTEKRGGSILTLPRSSLLGAACMLFGPAANSSQFVPAVERAATLLEHGLIREAQATLDRAGLPSISSDGALLARSVARRLGIAMPRVFVGTGSRHWQDALIKDFSRLYDEQYQTAAWLEPAFVRADWDPTKHPRWPRKTPDGQGGRFAPKDQSTSTSPDAEETAAQIREPSPGIGHNSGHVPEDPPELPLEEPSTAEMRRLVLRRAATWLSIQALRVGTAVVLDNPEVLLGLVIVGAAWLTYQDLARLKASLNPPQTLEQLQNAVNNPQPGTEVHHINEAQKGSNHPHANSKRFPDLIESWMNKVRIPYWAHRDVSDWYSTGQQEFGGQTPRDALRGKSWQEQYQYGLKVLRKFGVLK